MSITIYRLLEQRRDFKSEDAHNQSCNGWPIWTAESLTPVFFTFRPYPLSHTAYSTWAVRFRCNHSVMLLEYKGEAGACSSFANEAAYDSESQVLIIQQLYLERKRLTASISSTVPLE